MTDSAQAALVDFTNNGDSALTISVVIAGTEHKVATLQPGESIRQVTPGHVEWCFVTESGSKSTSDDGDSGSGLAEPGDGDDGKGDKKHG